MFQLKQTLHALGTDDFIHTFKSEIASLDRCLLPLQAGLSLSSYVSSEKISAIILKQTDEVTQITIKTGIFYTGIIAGCSCSDDPTPMDTQQEYCEVLLCIDKSTANTSVTLLP